MPLPKKKGLTRGEIAVGFHLKGSGVERMHVAGELSDLILRQGERWHASERTVADECRDVGRRLRSEPPRVGESRPAITAGGIGSVTHRAVLSKQRIRRGPGRRTEKQDCDDRANELPQTPFHK